MNLQPIIDCLPAPLKFLAMLTADETGLLRVRRRPWKSEFAKHLGRATEQSLAPMFRNQQVDLEWSRVQPELDVLAITEKAFAVNSGDRRALFYLVRGLGAQSILEIGTHIGGSTVHIAAALRETRRSNPAADVSLVTDDIHDVNDAISKPWLRHGSTYSPAEMIQRLGCGDFVVFQTAPALSYFATCGRTFDLIFLDGAHSARNTYQEIPIALGLLNPGGVILLHDYYPDLKRLWPAEVPIPGPYLGIRQLMRQGASADIRVLPLGDLPWLTRLGNCATSLALLVRNKQRRL